MCNEGELWLLFDLPLPMDMDVSFALIILASPSFGFLNPSCSHEPFTKPHCPPACLLSFSLV